MVSSIREVIVFREISSFLSLMMFATSFISRRCPRFILLRLLLSGFLRLLLSLPRGFGQIIRSCALGGTSVNVGYELASEDELAFWSRGRSHPTSRT